MRRILCRLRIKPQRFFIAVMLLAEISLAQTAEEYEVKGAFIYNFTKFVEWSRVAEAPFFSICILGDDPFEAAIERVTKGKTAHGRPFQVRRLREAADARQCQIAFVRAAEMGKAAKLIDATRGSSVLTVGESREFVRLGGMFFLSMENNHVRVVINKTATDNAGFKISANLMALAEIYKP
jgi:hypothetical protein